MMKNYEGFLSYLFNTETIDITQVVRSALLALNIFDGRKQSEDIMRKFPYPIEDFIINSLFRLRKDRIASLAKKSSAEMTRDLGGPQLAVFALQLFGKYIKSIQQRRK